MSISHRPGTMFGPVPPWIRVTQRVAAPSSGWSGVVGGDASSRESTWFISETALIASAGREVWPASPIVRTV